MATLDVTLLLGAVAVVGGFVSAVAGSSGMLMLPALLLVGTPVPVALGTNKFYTTISLLASSFRFVRKKIFEPRIWLITGIATFIGAIVGVVLVQIIDPGFLKTALPILIMLAALYSLFGKSFKLGSIPFIAKYRKAFLNTSSTMLGVYSGLIGAGTSLFWMALLTQVMQIDLVEANAVANYMCFVSNVTALVMFFIFSEVDIMLGLVLAVMGAVGAYFGANMAIKYSKKVIQPAMVFTTCVLAVKVLMSF